MESWSNGIAMKKQAMEEKIHRLFFLSIVAR
jgi:hypothetical protein